MADQAVLAMAVLSHPKVRGTVRNVLKAVSTVCPAHGTAAVGFSERWKEIAYKQLLPVCHNNSDLYGYNISYCWVEVLCCLCYVCVHGLLPAVARRTLACL